MAKESPWTPSRPTHGPEEEVAEGSAEEVAEGSAEERAEGSAEERAEERGGMLWEEMWKWICHGMSKGMEEETREARVGMVAAQCSTHPRPALQQAVPGPSPVVAPP